MALDRTALSMADLAYCEEPGAPAQRVSAAITAYLWTLDQFRDHPAIPGLRIGPSLNQWREHRATLPEVLT